MRWIGAVALVAAACGGSESRPRCDRNASDTAVAVRNELVAEWAADQARVELNGGTLSGAPCAMGEDDVAAIDAIASGKSEAYAEGCTRFEEADAECDRTCGRASDEPATQPP